MKKILSISLVLVMVLSLLSVSAFAAVETETVDVKWNFGYVGSSTHGTHANKINDAGTNYSYSDVIDMGPAGTTISFTDGDTSLASASAYVFSFWKKTADGYEIDAEATHIPGGFGGTSRAYTFTTTADKQAIRITYRSEQKKDYTPAAFEDVFVDGKKIDVKWNCGYVKADKTITENGSFYSYSDIIVVEKAGSKVTFTDTNRNGTAFCSDSAFVFSTWTQDGDNWTCVDGVKGTQGEHTDAFVPYTYTSTKDNELVRLGYNSGEKADAPVDASKRPVVTLTREVADAPVEPPVPTGDAAIVLMSVALISLAGVMVAKKRTSR